ncbi:hypothetical protein MUP77_19575 [Candidatus Bathyarchaeota archaeon]|nr:hypothetical protein [Candidatus Bathyarchaeota archaeon]
MYANLEGKETKAERIPLAPRPTTLKGKTVALYHNDKIASFPVMRTIRKQLEPLGVKEIFEVHAKTPWSRHPDRAIAEALKADIVFAGTCD